MSSKEGKLVFNGIPVGRDVFIPTNTDVPGPGQYEIVSPTPISVNKYGYLYDRFSDIQSSPETLKRSSSLKRRPAYSAEVQRERGNTNRQSIPVFSSKDLGNLSSLYRSETLNLGRPKSRLSSSANYSSGKTPASISGSAKTQKDIIKHLESSNTSLKLHLKKIASLSTTLLNSSYSTDQNPPVNSNLSTIRKLVNLCNNFSPEFLTPNKDRTASTIDTASNSSPSPQSHPSTDTNTQLPVSHNSQKISPSNANHTLSELATPTPAFEREYLDLNADMEKLSIKGGKNQIPSDIADLTSKNNHLLSENQDLKNSLSKLQLNLTQIQTDLEEIKIEKSLLDTTNKSLISQVDSLQYSTENQTEQLRTQSSELQDLEHLLDQKKSEVAESADKMLLLQNTQREIKDYLKKISELSQLVSSSETTISMLQSENAMLVLQSDSKNQKLKEQSQQVLALNNSISAKQSEIDEYAQKLALLEKYEKDYFTATEELQSLKQLSYTTDKQASEANSQNKTLKSAVQELQKSLDLANSKIISQETMLENSVKMAQDKQQEIDHLKRENSNIVKLLPQHNDCYDKIKNLENLSEELKQHNSELKNKVHEKNIELGGILTRKKKEQTALKLDLAKLNKELHDEKAKNSQLRSLEQQVNKFTRTNEQLKIEYDTAVAEVFNLKNRNEELRTKVEKYESLDLGAKVESLETHIKTLEQDLGANNNEKSSLKEQIESIQKAKVKYESQLEIANSQVNDLIAANADFKVIQVNLEKERERMFSQMKTIKKNFMEKEKALDEQINALRKNLELYRTKADSLDKELIESATESKMQKATYKTNLDTITTDLKRAEDELKSVQAQLKIAEEKARFAEYKLDSIENDFENEKRSAAEKQSLLVNHSKKTADLEAELGSSKQLLAELSLKLEKTLKKWADAEQRAENSEDAVRLINNKFVLAMDELSKAEVQLKQKR